MRMELRQTAPENQRFGPGAFDRSVGTTVPLTENGATVGHATIVGVVISEDGTEAVLTLDVDSPRAQDVLRPDMSGTVFGVRPHTGRSKDDGVRKRVAEMLPPERTCLDEVPHGPHTWVARLTSIYSCPGVSA